jgi:YesN/AraC family two-component response regulator
MNFARKQRIERRTMVNDRYQILIVDDDPQIPRLIKSWLDEEFSCIADVLSVSSSEEAFGRMHDSGVELLITDIDMPSLNGYHLLKEIKLLEPLTQVLFLTGQPSQEAIRSALRMGADEYVLKPVKRQSMVTCVRYLLDRVQRWRTELGLEFGMHEGVDSAIGCEGKAARKDWSLATSSNRCFDGK